MSIKYIELKTKLFILLGLITLILSCDQSKPESIFEELNHEHYTSKKFSNISIFQNQIAISGTAKITDHELDVKSPFILFLDSLFNVVDFKFYKTETTASNILLKPLNNQDYALAYYAAKSIENQEEESTIKLIKNSGVFNKLKSYGSRTRIKDLKAIDESKFATLNYERSTQEMSLRIFNSYEQSRNIKIVEGQETNIPTDVEILPESKIALSGIANGFHYLDGHNYENPIAYSFIVKLDSEGSELKRYIRKKRDHVFITDILADDKNVVFIGSEQTIRTGMDIIFGQLDSNFELNFHKQYQEEGIQEAHKIIFVEDSYYLYGTTEDLENHKMMLQLLRIDKNGNIIWNRTLGVEGASNSAADMMYFDSHILLLSYSKELRTSPYKSQVYKISQSGDIENQVNFN